MPPIISAAAPLVPLSRRDRQAQLLLATDGADCGGLEVDLLLGPSRSLDAPQQTARHQSRGWIRQTVEAKRKPVVELGYQQGEGMLWAKTAHRSADPPGGGWSLDLSRDRGSREPTSQIFIPRDQPGRPRRGGGVVEMAGASCFVLE